MPPLLALQDLTTHFLLSDATVKAVTGLSFTLDRGKTMALVGESGCGKSVTAASIMRLVRPPGRIVRGSISFAEQDLLALPEEAMRKIRGNRIGMIFQEPMTSLNPVLTIGEQIAEGLQLHRQLARRDALQKAVTLLSQVGIPSPEQRVKEYPHQLSGGMRQRVMIAMALSCGPELLLADEPTTALDVTIQAQILELIDRLVQEHDMALLLITHDLGIVAERVQATAIMYAGEIVEYAPTAVIISNPLHPYTQGLLDSLPQRAKPGQPLRTIPGTVPSLALDLPGCGFCERCPERTWQCERETPALAELSPGHLVRCWKYR